MEDKNATTELVTAEPITNDKNENTQIENQAAESDLMKSDVNNISEFKENKSKSEEIEDQTSQNLSEIITSEIHSCVELVIEKKMDNFDISPMENVNKINNDKIENEDSAELPFPDASKSSSENIAHTDISSNICSGKEISENEAHAKYENVSESAECSVFTKAESNIDIGDVPIDIDKQMDQKNNIEQNVDLDVSALKSEGNVQIEIPAKEVTDAESDKSIDGQPRLERNVSVDREYEQIRTLEIMELTVEGPDEIENYNKEHISSVTSHVNKDDFEDKYDTTFPDVPSKNNHKVFESENDLMTGMFSSEDEEKESDSITSKSDNPNKETMEKDEILSETKACSDLYEDKQDECPQRDEEETLITNDTEMKNENELVAGIMCAININKEPAKEAEKKEIESVDEEKNCENETEKSTTEAVVLTSAANTSLGLLATQYVSGSSDDESDSSDSDATSNISDSGPSNIQPNPSGKDSVSGEGETIIDILKAHRPINKSYESESSSESDVEIISQPNEIQTIIDVDMLCDDETIITKAKVPIRTKGELSLEDLPPIQDLQISVPEHECVELGKVESIVDQLVLVNSLPGTIPLNLDTVLFLEKGQKVLGEVFDVLGQVSNPLYCVRFNSNNQIKERGIEIGQTVFVAPRTDHTQFVILPDLLKIRGSDASWEDDTEPSAHNLAYSDDEEERAARRNLRNKNQQNDDPNNPKKQRFTPGANRSHPSTVGAASINSYYRPRAQYQSQEPYEQNSYEQYPEPPAPPVDHTDPSASGRQQSMHTDIFNYNYGGSSWHSNYSNQPQLYPNPFARIPQPSSKQPYNQPRNP